MSDGAQLTLIILACIACVKLAALRNEAKRLVNEMERIRKLAERHR